MIALILATVVALAVSAQQAGVHAEAETALARTCSGAHTDPPSHAADAALHILAGAVSASQLRAPGALIAYGIWLPRAHPSHNAESSLQARSGLHITPQFRTFPLLI
ncbi:MAG: hypothetical protein GEU99_20095 [Luteitalea sp.]|nr:hypothetical protein [Luteitalea sp.]